VALYDAAGIHGDSAAAWVAAGMIAPIAESAVCDPQIESQIESMGRRSLSIWPKWLSELPAPVFYRESGTIMVWHREDAGEAVRVERAPASRYSQSWIQLTERSHIAELEPALSARFSEALYIPGEAQVDNREFLIAVAGALEAGGVACHWWTRVENGALPPAGTIVDCRGFGAKSSWPKLRGVRGEIVRLHAPEIELQHMVRLLHPRCPVYIVPRAGGRLVVGATSIESDDLSPVSVRGALELLSSAYSVLPALAEARILEFGTQVRPALPDNLPALRWDRRRNILSVNGLYRHGFLLTPAVVEKVLSLVSIQEKSTLFGSSGVQEEVEACLSL
jgi:glycine oxidase